MDPIIGVACGHRWQEPERYYVNASYVQRALHARGTPVLLPYMDKSRIQQLVGMVQGLIIPGGIDIDPLHFHQQPHPLCGAIDPLWDELDIRLITEGLRRDIPILAICRGCQILNVAAGGDLIQDIGSHLNKPLKHMQAAQKWYATHSIEISEESLLYEILGRKSIFVNSFHHQAVGTIASEFRVSAKAPDNIIEAIESTKHRFVVGVQWHPELMGEAYPIFNQLFTRFVASSRETVRE